MIRALELIEVGPMPRLRIDFASRLNVFAGDNGLGKSFVLDVLWWALTGTWVGLPALPRQGASTNPEIAIAIDRAAAGDSSNTWQIYQNATLTSDRAHFVSRFIARTQQWPLIDLSTADVRLPALILSIRTDGGFALWDPARNEPKKHSVEPGVLGHVYQPPVVEPVWRPSAYLFSSFDLWNGLEDQGKTLCNGLIRDWVSWQERRGPDGGERQEFVLLRNTLAQLSPHPDMPFRPGPPVRLFLDDTREFPTIDFGYGPVPVIHASAGMQRILALAYLIVWAWHEHLAACHLLGRAPVQDVVLLMDEVDSHLHPTWQRRIVGALLRVLEGLAAGVRVQACLTTHAPLVLASLEPLFDETRDRLWVFDMDPNAGVTLSEMPWAKQGDAVSWLVSAAFGLQQGRSIEAERAIEAAEAWMRGDRHALPEGLTKQEDIHQELLRVLAGHDPFWPRWVVWTEKAQGAA